MAGHLMMLLLRGFSAFSPGLPPEPPPEPPAGLSLWKAEISEPVYHWSV